MSEIKLANRNKETTKRRGRGPGTGLGKTSGRGHKGQKARAGGGVRRGFEGGQMPLYRRLPKRGFTNIFRKNVHIVQLSDILVQFDNGGTVDPASLEAKGLIHSKPGVYVKILNNVKEFGKKINFKVNGISASAKVLVEKAGGTVELLKSPVKRLKKEEVKG
jgi:large subunit ribosomal protein L15